jgi:regulator of protease activity HflC (stomatin/prohibitin superfamily)
MRNLTLIVLGLFVTLSLTGCWTNVPAGHEGVLINKVGSEKGIDLKTVTPGRYFLTINEELYLFPTFTQNYTWTREIIDGDPTNEEMTLQTKEGLEVTCDIGISYHIQQDKIAAIFQKYRKGVEEITDIYLRNMVRDALVAEASVLPVEAVYGAGKAELIARVQKQVTDQCKEIGIVVENIYLIGSFRLPQPVIEALNAKIGATQKSEQRENEIREATAAAEKVKVTAMGEAAAILTRAKAQADANKILAASITPEYVTYMMIQKWDGVLPKVSSGSGMNMLMDIGNVSSEAKLPAEKK